MTSWKPRVWPLPPSLALDYAGVDARPLSRLDRLPGIIGLRLTGRRIGLASAGKLALVDLTRRPVSGLVLADLPEAAAQRVGFEGRAFVMRAAAADPRGVILRPFTTGQGLYAADSLLVPHEWVLGRVVATVDFKTREWSTWARAEKRLAAVLLSTTGPRLTIESATFGELRDRVTAAARVYGNIDQPEDLMDRAFPRRLAPAARREYRDAVRWARAKGLSPRELAAVGGDQ